MTRWETDDLGSVADLERDESRAARADIEPSDYFRGTDLRVEDAPQLEWWEQ